MLFLSTGACGGSEPVPPPAVTADSIGVCSPLNSHCMLRPEVGAEEGLLRFGLGEARGFFRSAIPAAGDFDGDGVDTMAVFDLLGGEVWVRDENAPGPMDRMALRVEVTTPEPGMWPPPMLPVALDLDGDGVDSVGVFEAAAGVLHLADGTIGTGLPRGLPFGGDFDGDGIDSPGVWVPATGEVHGTGPVYTLSGAPLSMPVVGDFDRDGIDEVGLYDLQAGEATLPTENASGADAVRIRMVPEGSTLLWWPLAGQWGDAAPPLEQGFAWETAAPADEAMDLGLLDAAYDQAAEMQRLHSLLVVRGGRLVAEEYFHGFDAAMPGNIKSVSKSFLSALFGIAYAEGIVDPEDRIADFLPEMLEGAGPEKQDLRVAHLLTMTAGLEWKE